MEPTVKYIVRVLEGGQWKDWGACDSLPDALDAMHGANQWNPVPGREWQVLVRQTVDMRHIGNHAD